MYIVYEILYLQVHNGQSPQTGLIDVWYDPIMIYCQILPGQYCIHVALVILRDHTYDVYVIITILLSLNLRIAIQIYANWRPGLDGRKP